MKKYLPTNDLLFKKMLTSEDSSHILKAFVRDLLEIEFKELHPKETYHIDSYKKSYEKMDILRTEVDILATAEDGSHSTIECQVQPHDYFNERSLFYLIEAFRAPFGNQSSEGFIEKNNFSSLRPAYGINVIDFHLSEEKSSALQRFRLLNERSYQPFTGMESKELLILCFLSLKGRNDDRNSAVSHWRTFLKSGDAADDAPDYIKEAKRKINFFTLEEEERAMIMKIDKAKAIRDAELSTAFRNGGKENRKKNALNAIKLGLTSEQIAEITELSIEEIEKLKKGSRIIFIVCHKSNHLLVVLFL